MRVDQVWSNRPDRLTCNLVKTRVFKPDPRHGSLVLIKLNFFINQNNIVLVKKKK